MPARVKPLNLLPKPELEKTLWGRILKWALTGGRYIVILTELVVIIAFLSRFKLDQDMSNLGERINGKKNVLEVQAATEARFRQIQNKIDLVKKMRDERMKADEIFSALEADVPSGVRLLNLMVEGNSIVFSALADSEISLANFLRQESQNGKWREVELTSVSASTQPGVSFAIKIWL